MTSRTHQIYNIVFEHGFDPPSPVWTMFKKTTLFLRLGFPKQNIQNISILDNWWADVPRKGWKEKETRIEGALPQPMLFRILRVLATKCSLGLLGCSPLKGRLLKNQSFLLPCPGELWQEALWIHQFFLPCQRPSAEKILCVRNPEESNPTCPNWNHSLLSESISRVAASREKASMLPPTAANWIGVGLPSKCQFGSSLWWEWHQSSNKC